MENNAIVTHSSDIETPRASSRLAVWLKQHSLLAFFLLTFSITWGLWFLLLALQSGVLPVKLAEDSLTATLLFRVAGWGPAVSAIVMTALVDGKSALRDFFKSIVNWRVGWRWYATALFTFLAIVLAVTAIYIPLGGTFTGNPYMSVWYMPVLLYIPGVLFAAVMAAIPEEPGWRGYALPRLLSRYHPLFAGLLLGVIWGLWHLPIYILDADTPLNFALFMLQTPALSVLITWVYINAKRSVLLCILFHAAIDAAWTIFYQGEGPMIVVLLLTAGMWIAVLIVLARFGPRLSRQYRAA